MTVQLVTYPLHNTEYLHLSHTSYQNKPSLSWQRAIFWEKKAWVYEGNLSAFSDTVPLLLFCPENKEEMWKCLLEAFHFQQGKEEAEWAMLAIHALRFEINQDFLTKNLTPHVSLVSIPTIWNWVLKNETLVRISVQYKISIRLLYNWQEDIPWLTWMKEALPLLHANGNQLRQIRHGFQSLASSKGWSLEKILEELQWQEIASNNEPPIKKLEILNIRLKQMRYPQFTVFETKLKKLSQNIHQKTGWTLGWPPFLEGDTLTISIPLRKPDDIACIPSRLSVVQHYLLQSLELLRGEYDDQ